MENHDKTQETQHSAWDVLLGPFSVQEINTVKGIIEIAEKHISGIKTEDFKKAYAQYNVNNILDLLRGLDPDNLRVLGKFEERGITGIQIGDQTVRIAEKPQDKPDIILSK
jgi:hypothetical protein